MVSLEACVTLTEIQRKSGILKPSRSDNSDVIDIYSKKMHILDPHSERLGSMNQTD